MADAFEEQLKEIEAANAHEADELEPGAGEPQKKPEPDDTQGEPGEQLEKLDVSEEAVDDDDTLELTDGDEAVDADDDDETAEEDEGEDGKRRRSKPAKQRIAELTAKLREAERQLAAANSNPEEEAKEPVKPNPDDFEYGEADPKYIDAVTDYKLEVRDADRKKGETQQRQKQAMMDRLQTGLAKAEAEGQDKYEDFDAKVSEAANLRGEPLPPILTVGLAVSPVGHDIIYRLATDEAVSERLESLARGQSPKMMAMALGELEGEYLDDTSDADLDINDELDTARMMGRMRARAAGRKAEAPAKKEVVVTKAPEPPAKRARGGAGKASTRPDTDDINAFMRDFGKDLGR